MRIAILILLINAILSSVVDRNGVKFDLPIDWDGRWTLTDPTYKFKSNYLFSIGEGMLKKLTEQECNNQRDKMRNMVNIRLNGNNIYKATNVIDMYGVSVNEFVSLISNDRVCYSIKAFYEMSIAEEMERGLNEILNSFLIKN